MGDLLEAIIDILQPAFPYFTEVWYIVGALAVIALLIFWWVYRVISKIQSQREYGVFILQSATKVWKRAQFVPEDLRERESRYLYDELIRTIDDAVVPFPMVVKKGEPRAMTKDEYDKVAKLRDKLAFSPPLFLLSLAYGFMVFLANFQEQMSVALVAALVLPIMQLLLYCIIRAFRRKKNKFRIALFQGLKEPSADFIKITKPFIIFNSYPARFGVEQGGEKKRFITVGELPDKLLQECSDFFQRQQAMAYGGAPATPAPTQSPIPTSEPVPVPEPVAMPAAAPSQPPPAPVPVAADTNKSDQRKELKAALAAATADFLMPPEPVAPQPSQEAPTAPPPATKAKSQKDIQLETFNKLDELATVAKQRRAAAKKTATPPPETPPEPPTPPTPPTPPEPPPPMAEPQETKNTEEFSVDSIGNALEQELERRRKKTS